MVICVDYTTVSPPLRIGELVFISLQILSILILDKIDKTVSIEAKNLDIEEGGVKLRVTIIDTPGFFDSLNGEDR